MWVWSSKRTHSRFAGYYGTNFSDGGRHLLHVALALLACAGAASSHAADSVYTAEPIPGATVESLLQYAREHNPEYAAMKLEATAADERVYPAGALPDPRFR